MSSDMRILFLGLETSKQRQFKMKCPVALLVHFLFKKSFSSRNRENESILVFIECPSLILISFLFSLQLLLFHQHSLAHVEIEGVLWYFFFFNYVVHYMV